MNVTIKPKIVHALLFFIPVFFLIYMVYSHKLRNPFYDYSLHHEGCESIGVMDKMLDIEDVQDCDVLNKIYDVRIEGAPFQIPETMRGKVRKWLQNKEDLIKDAHLQRVIQITNKELSTYNFIFQSQK